VKSLSKLLKEVDALFPHASRKPHLSSEDYTLGRFPYGWSFSVSNSWHRWGDAGLIYEFGAWSTPEGALQEFLDYVKSNNINVESLMDKYAEQSVERTPSKRGRKASKVGIIQLINLSE
jgi:hypothetical protein